VQKKTYAGREDRGEGPQQNKNVEKPRKTLTTLNTGSKGISGVGGKKRGPWQRRVRANVKKKRLRTMAKDETAREEKDTKKKKQQKKNKKTLP